VIYVGFSPKHQFALHSTSVKLYNILQIETQQHAGNTARGQRTAPTRSTATLTGGNTHRRKTNYRSGPPDLHRRVLALIRRAKCRAGKTCQVTWCLWRIHSSGDGDGREWCLCCFADEKCLYCLLFTVMGNALQDITARVETRRFVCCLRAVDGDVRVRFRRANLQNTKLLTRC